MAKSLHTGEKVHIMVYDEQEEACICRLLENAGLDMTHIDFWLVPSDDVWSRDTEPIFVRDGAGELRIVDFGLKGDCFQNKVWIAAQFNHVQSLFGKVWILIKLCFIFLNTLTLGIIAKVNTIKTSRISGLFSLRFMEDAC